MRRFGSIFIVVFILSGAVFPVSADPTKIVPFISMNQEYSDNIIFTADNEEDDFITTVSGGLAVKHNTEVINASLNARLDQFLYKEFDQLDSLDKFFSGNVHYRTTERLGVGATALYSEDSRRDRDTATTGLLVSGDRDTTRFSLSSDYLFSEITKGDIKLDFGRVETEGIYQDEDNDGLRLDISFSRNLSETFKNTTGLLNFSYLHYTADVDTTIPGAVQTSSVFQDNTSDIFQLSTGFSKNITEIYNIYCLLGASYSKTDEELRVRNTLTGGLVSDVTFPDQEDETWGGVLSAGLNYDGLYYDMGLSLSQDMRAGSGTNGAVQRSSVSGNIYGNLTDKFFIRLDASCYLNQNERTNQADTDDLTFNIQPGFGYKFSHDFVLSCFYRFTSVEDRENNITRERNMIYLMIKKEFEF